MTAGSGRPALSARVALAATLLGLPACATADPDNPPAAPFGTVSVVAGGRAWLTRAESGDVVARWDPGTGHLQITGVLREPNGDEKIVAMAGCRPLPGGSALPRVVDVRHHFESLLGEGVIGAWTETWTDPYHFIRVRSIGQPGDHLTIEDLDPAALTISGSFRFHTESYDKVTRLLVTGRFLGQVEIVSRWCPS